MRALLSALLVMGCRIDLDERETSALCISGTVAVCQEEAVSHSDFEWIQKNIFSSNCAGSSCHGRPENGSIPDGKLVLSGDLDPVNDPDGALAAYRTVMGADRKGIMSQVAEGRQLVVPGNAEASYLFFLMRGISPDQGEPPFDPPPDNVGYMPRRAKPLCCEKIEAVGRWIEAGGLPPSPAQP